MTTWKNVIKTNSINQHVTTVAVAVTAVTAAVVGGVVDDSVDGDDRLLKNSSAKINIIRILTLYFRLCKNVLII